MSRYQIDIKWGLIFTAAAILWMAGERLAGLHSDHIDKHALYSNGFAIVAIGVYVMAMRDKKANDFQGRMSYKQGLVCGLVVTLVVAVLSPLSQYLTVSVLSPKFFTNSINYAVSQQTMTQAEAEAYFNLKNFMQLGVMFGFGMGIVTSAIVAVFVRSK